MVISKEAKVGFIGVAVLLAFLVIFNHLKKHNAFSTNLIITARFDDIEFLKKGDLVLIKGREYGRVSAIYMVDGERRVDMDIETIARIPPNATAYITELSLLGGRTINITYTGACTDDCLQSGAIIPGTVNCLKDQAAAFAGPMLKKFGTFADTLMGPNGMENMLAAAYTAASGLSKSTKNFENKMRGMSQTLPGSIKGFRDMTDNFLAGNGSTAETVTGDEKTQLALDSLLKNISSLTQKDIEEMTKILYTLGEQSKKLPEKIEQGKKALAKADAGLEKLSTKVAAFQPGAKGTIPKLLYDGDFKDSLSYKIQNVSQKLQDIRRHPEENLSLKKK